MTSFKMLPVKSKKYKGVFYYKRNNDIVYFFRYSKQNVVIKKVVGKKSEGITELIVFEKKLQSIQNNNVKDLPFSTIADKYFYTQEITSTSIKNYKRMYQLRIAKTEFNNMRISEVEKLHIKEFQRHLLQDCNLSRGTVKNYTGIITSVFKYAIKNKYFFGESPTKDCKLNNCHVIREKFLSIEEIKLLFKNISHDNILYLFVTLAVTTGARFSSILNIKKKDIDVGNLFINIRDTKNNTTYKVFIAKQLLTLIKQKIAILENQNSFLFSDNGLKFHVRTLQFKLKKVFDNLFNQGLDESDSVNRVVIHTLRHTFASNLAILGLSLDKIGVLLNHKKASSGSGITGRYAKLSPDNGRDEVMRFVDSIF